MDIQFQRVYSQTRLNYSGLSTISGTTESRKQTTETKGLSNAEMLRLSRYKTQFNMSVVTDQGTQPSVNSVFLNSINYKARMVTRFKRYLLQKEKFQVSMWAGFFSFNTFDKK